MLRSGRNYDMRAASKSVALLCLDESRTLQSQADEANINTIVRRFGVSGTMPVIPLPPPIEAFDEVFDFQSAMNVIAEAKLSFSRLDADLRTRFGNDPEKFVAFCHNPENIDELRKMGLAVPKAEPVVVPPMRVEVVNAPVDDDK